jgi:hypothetical protein
VHEELSGVVTLIYLPFFQRLKNEFLIATFAPLSAYFFHFKRPGSEVFDMHGIPNIC